ncbi:hypothetical protein MAUB1S_11755 [Mycolicibacterium aubagnense]
MHGVTRRQVKTAAATVLAAAMIPAMSACSDQGNSGGAPAGGPSSPSASGPAKHGPMFPVCGGVSDQTVSQLTQVAGLVNTAKNSVGCQWLVNGGILGPHFSFTWYRGSPIGRERKTEERTRADVNDINIQGHSGFVALGEDPMIGKSLCEVGIQFDDDFIEWSISFSQKPFPDPCDIAKELARQSIANAK